MGICKNRYSVINIKQINLRPINDYAIIGDGYYILMPTKRMVDIIIDEDNILDSFTKYYPDPTGESDYLKFYLPSSFTNAIFSSSKTLTIIIDHWEMNLPLNSDFFVSWAKEDLCKKELENVIDTVQAINFGLIDEVKVLDNMTKYPTRNWISEYIWYLDKI